MVSLRDFQLVLTGVGFYALAQLASPVAQTKGRYPQSGSKRQKLIFESLVQIAAKFLVRIICC